RGWETRALPFAGMRCPVGTWLRPKGAAAYQPGVQPQENMAPSMRCSVGHGESRAHGSTSSGDGKPGRCPSLVCGVPLGHGFAPKGWLHISLGCNHRKTWHQERKALVS
ncbi:MAG: hypothetical protein ACKO4R_00490, partial [Synechococcales cyanobacterium]